jgi:hypothetical protein
MKAARQVVFMAKGRGSGKATTLRFDGYGPSGASQGRMGHYVDYLRRQYPSRLVEHPAETANLRYIKDANSDSVPNQCSKSS